MIKHRFGKSVCLNAIRFLQLHLEIFWFYEFIKRLELVSAYAFKGLQIRKVDVLSSKLAKTIDITRLIVAIE